MTFPSPGIIAATRKWECSPDEFRVVRAHWIDSPLDVPIMRYSDVLLMAAEAQFILGNTPEAC